MISKEYYEKARLRAIQMLENAGIALTPEEKQNIEIADFGLGRQEETGLQILTYINTSRVCAKELVLFPYQTCPEHCHADSKTSSGKEETFRCRWGKVYLYVPGERQENIKAKKFWVQENEATVFHEIELTPGEQYTIYPGTLHWFQAGSEGAVISEFSTTSTDETDIFTDKNIKRITRIN